MLLPVKLICDRRRVRKDGTSLIFIQYCKNAAEKTILNTGIAVPPHHWNKKLNRVCDHLPPEYGNPVEISKELQRQLRLAEDIVRYAQEKKMMYPVQFLRETFTPDFNLRDLDKHARDKPSGKPKVNLDFFYQMDEYIKFKQGVVAPSTMHVFKNLKLILQSFQTFRRKPITFEEIDLNFYEEFIHYLRFDHIHHKRKEIIRGFKTNSVGKNIKQLIVFLRNRKAKKIIVDLDLTGFKIPEEEADAIYLSPEEIKKLLQLDLSHHPLLKYRDLFVFGCYTGLRFSDYSVIRAEDVRNGILYKKQGKTRHWVVVPLRDEADHIFHYSFNRNIPHVTNPEFNRYIKEIGKLAGFHQPIKHSYMKGNKNIVETRPKYEWITSHTCRRSFCTNEFLAGTPVELIMKISGHKSLKDFYRYIKIAPEQAGQRIREIWQQRGEMMRMGIIT